MLFNTGSTGRKGKERTKNRDWGEMGFLKALKSGIIGYGFAIQVSRICL